MPFPAIAMTLSVVGKREMLDSAPGWLELRNF